MVNVVNKMCEVPNCFKRPSLNYPGVRPAVRCGEHKLEGMTNAFRKAPTPKSSSENGAVTHRPRVKSSDGDTTDSGSDADESCPLISEPSSGSKQSDGSATQAAEASSPSSNARSSSGPLSRHYFPLVLPRIQLPDADPAKRARGGSGVAAQRAALTTLSVGVDDLSSADSAAASSPSAAAASAASGKMMQCKDVLKSHLCQVQRRAFVAYPPISHVIARLQELCKAGLNGMEQTVEKCAPSRTQIL